MAHVFDVAQYIVNKLGRISTIKLQKLVYYSKAWSLVWDEDPLFPEEVQAWAIGPVVPVLYEVHKGQFFSPMNFKGADPDTLTEAQKETIDLVIASYGPHDPQFLVALSHSEQPWRMHRRGLRDYETGHEPISDLDIAEYYSRLEI